MKAVVRTLSVRRSLAIFLMAGCTAPTLAVIKIEFPVSRVLKESPVVAVAELTVISGGSLECAVRERIKGTLPAATVMLDAPDYLSADSGSGQPVVLFMRDDGAIVHLADAWHRAQRMESGRWRIDAPYPMVKNYPGRTAGLVAILRDMRDGKPGIKDAIGHEFVGALMDRGNLGIAPISITTADVNGDGSPDLLVCTTAGARLFLAVGERYEDVTASWGLLGASGRYAAAGDIDADGRTDLLVGSAIWRGEQGRFTKSAARLELPDERQTLAAALLDADGDGRSDAVCLTGKGILAIATNPGNANVAWPTTSTALWQDDRTALAAHFARDWGDDGGWYAMVVHPADIARYPVGATGAPPCGLRRLTGIELTSCPSIGPLPLAVDLCVGFDYDGNGLTDLLLLTRGGGLTLANRGYGTMLINAFMHRQFRADSVFKGGANIPKLPFAVSPSLCVAPGRRAGRTGRGLAQNLLLLRADGQLFELINRRQ